MPAKRVIILDQVDQRTFRYVLWADVPVARRPFYAVAGKTSVWTGAAATDNAALTNGSVVERVDHVVVPEGTSLPDVRTLLQAQWVGFQDEITASNPWSRYGSFWDGTTWTPSGVT